jgi:hypothetical protein
VLGDSASSGKPKTFSFPVVRKFDGRKGFLVPSPFDASGNDYFVDDTKIGDGSASSPLGFSPSEGIAYEFLAVYPEF